MTRSRIAVFASGNGSNAEQIFRHFKGHPSIEVVLLLCNDADAFALERARKFDVPSKVFTRQQFRESHEILSWLNGPGVSHLVLAGFLWLIPQPILETFSGRIINIHPALLPKFGGKGMYGMKVHEQVKASGDHETGITIHEVNEKYDDGKILFQSKCAVHASDTPEEISGKVNLLEWEHYPRVIEGWILEGS